MSNTEATTTVNQAPCALTIGNFDGLHLGHKQLIRTLTDLAQRHNLATCAISFDPTPTEYFAKLNQQPPPPRLITTDDRINKLRNAGVDQVVLIGFDSHLQELSAERFFQKILIETCQARVLVVGNDFRFGNNRHGDIDLLKKLGKEAGCIVESVHLRQHKHNQKISSSTIRTLLSDNRIDEANALLGYQYYSIGRIVHGDDRGRQLGFATANLDTQLPILLKGVFATQMQLADGRNIEGVTNIGVKPTFHNGIIATSCETHLFDFNENLYNSEVKLSFYKHLRAEKKFDCKEQLIAQIQSDVSSAKKYFGR